MTHRISRLHQHRRLGIVLAVTGALALAPAVADAQVVRSGSGIGVASATAARDLFRDDLGGGIVSGANGSFGGLRREINWDGVPDGASSPFNLPGNFFNTNSPRGVVITTPGTGIQVSASAGNPNGAATNFGNINLQYSSTFSAFSPQRLFTPIGSNITDVTFFVAGTGTPGLTRGFGSIFSDVDAANISSIEFFDGNNLSLGSFFVPNVAGATSSHFSFLGVSFANPVVSRVRITTGNAPLAAATLDQNGNPTDLVVMDDFLYGEVAATVVPEPSTLGMLGFGLVSLVVGARRRSITRGNA